MNFLQLANLHKEKSERISRTHKMWLLNEQFVWEILYLGSVVRSGKIDWRSVGLGTYSVCLRDREHSLECLR